MNRTAHIDGELVRLASPEHVPPCNFVGRAEELFLCKVAWGIDAVTNRFATRGVSPLHFRLEGPPGVGKNEIVYQLARQLELPFYSIQGHEELTPEDLALLLVPDSEALDQRSTGLALRASPLATAIYEGGLFFFDEISRVPERALSPLASVLDGRQHVYSAITGLRVAPRDEEARSRFRFCCALNPGLSASGYRIPDYIAQRTLPVIPVATPPLDDLIDILRRNLRPPDDLLAAFQQWYEVASEEELSVRQATAIVAYAINYHGQQPGNLHDIIRTVAALVLRYEPGSDAEYEAG